MTTIYFRNPNQMLLVSEIATQERAKECVNIATAPKCGTHLLIKALKELDIPYKFLNASPHLFGSVTFQTENRSDVAHIVRQLKNDEKYIGIYRDPRDYFISYLQWIDLQKDRVVPKSYLSTPFDQKLDWALLESIPSNYAGFTNFSDHTNSLYSMLALKIAEPENFLCVAFEDLIGPEYGGNSKEAQKKVIEKIVHFCDAKVSDEKIEQVISGLYGNTVTFSEHKKVGRWKDFFKDRHIDYIKSLHNNLICQLGYEENKNWGPGEAS